jgi:hypothetical protein
VLAGIAVILTLVALSRSLTATYVKIDIIAKLGPRLVFP